MNESPRSRIYATFEVVGSFDPDAFTASTGLQPTRTSRVGAPIGLLFTKADRWVLSTEHEQGWDLTVHIERLLGSLAPHRDRLLSFSSQHRDVRAIVFGVSEFIDVTPSLVLSPTTLRSIADLGATFEFDQTALKDDPNGS